MESKTTTAQTLGEVLALPVDWATTCVCLDLDDVCVTVADSVGTEAWESRLARELGSGSSSSSMSDGQARGVAGQMWRALNWVVPTRTPEAETAGVVRRLQQRAAHVVGLTARDAVLTSLTRRQLMSHGIELSAGGEPEAVLQLGAGVVYSGGVVFCSDKSKREALRRYLCATEAVRAATRQPPLSTLERCVHVDDKSSHLLDLAAGFRGEPDDSGGQLPPLLFHGVHYTRVADDQEHMPVDAQLDPMSRALARALASEDAREHLKKVIRAAEGDTTLWYSKY